MHHCSDKLSELLSGRCLHCAGGLPVNDALIKHNIMKGRPPLVTCITQTKTG